jgi:Bacterial pre-peptidase C-terminal domain
MARDVVLTSTSIAYNDYVGPSDTLDYYRFTTTTATHFSLGMNGLSADADVYLLNSQGTEVAHSYNSGTSAEAIDIASLAAGTYYVQVKPYGTASTNYALAVSATTVADDLAGNTLATARVVTLGSPQNVYKDSVGPSDPVDYYKFTTTRSTPLLARYEWPLRGRRRLSSEYTGR